MNVPNQERFKRVRLGEVILDSSVEASYRDVVLEQLCRLHWPTIYWDARRSGFESAEAEDLAQEFFSGLFRRNSLAGYSPAKGNLRTFLLASFRHFTIDHRRRTSAKKRGGEYKFVPFEEEIGGGQATGASEPSSASDLAWASSILERATQMLRDYYENSGKGAIYNAIEPFLESSENEQPDYSSLAVHLELSEPGVRSAVYRMRKRFQSFVLAIVDDDSSDEDYSE